jgi:hypothetical protein
MKQRDDILQDIAQKAAEMLSRGERPQVLRVGQLQAEALDRLGHTGDTLTVAAPTSQSQTAAHAGQTNPMRHFDEVSLLVERTDATDQLEVHGYP